MQLRGRPFKVFLQRFRPKLTIVPPQPLEFHPVPLPAGEEGEYVLALKQELRGAMRQLPYFIRPAVPKRGQCPCPAPLGTRATQDVHSLMERASRFPLCLNHIGLLEM